MDELIHTEEINKNDFGRIDKILLEVDKRADQEIKNENLMNSLVYSMISLVGKTVVRELKAQQNAQAQDSSPRNGS